jgi:MYXO-CTERM domain-containing protein
MIVLLVTLLAVSPAAAQDCDDVEIYTWSPTDPTKLDVTSDEDFVGIGQHVYFEATYLDDDGEPTDAPAGCDPTECAWLISGWTEAKGGLVANCDSPGPPGKDTVGDVVCYYAPEDLEDCLDIELGIALDCSDAGLGDWNSKPKTLLTVGPVPDDNQSETRPQFERCSVSGGGCISPQSSGESSSSAAWLLFPLLGLGGLARRRQD